MKQKIKDQKSVATVKNITLHKPTGEIVITVSANDSMYIQKAGEYGFDSLINAAPLVEGLNILLEHHYHAVKAMKECKDFQSLIKENTHLKELIAIIADFENGGSVKIKGLNFQKAINEHSFYSEIKKSLTI